MKSSESNNSSNTETSFALASSPINETSDHLHNPQKSIGTSLCTKSSPYMVKNLEEEKTAQYFRMCLEIKGARDLPLNTPIKTKQFLKRSTANKGRYKRSSLGQEPSTYVTFQTGADDGHTIKSHEGMVCSTSVVQFTSNPAWRNSFNITLSFDYLTNNKRFILKIWRKTSTSSSSRLLPTPLDDSIIGFTTLDLMSFLRHPGVINDWFNIVDFNGHINGQLHVAARPMDDLKKYINITRYECDNQVDDLLDNFESNLNINIDLSSVIKKKFTELEEISQRLRTRLLNVTSDTNYIADLPETSDEQLEEFERDLNTTAFEDENETLSFFSRLECSNNIKMQTSPQIQ